MESKRGRILMVEECWWWQCSSGINGVERIIMVVALVLGREGGMEGKKEGKKRIREVGNNNCIFCCIIFLHAL